MSSPEHHAVIGGTRAGKAAWLAQQAREFAEEHPLGTVTRYGAVVLLQPGPPVVRGEVLERRDRGDAPPGVPA